MIVRCPACERSYRLDDARFDAGRTMRCAGCGHQFKQAAGVAPEAQSKEKPPAPKPAPSMPRPERATQLRSVPAMAARKPQPAPGDDEAAPLVLLAAGDRPFRYVVGPILDRLGCRVEFAADGTDTFRRLVAHRPGLLIASVHLSGLSGVAICEGVKGSPHLKQIKVALVGSVLSSDLFNRDTAMAYGADLFLDERMKEEALAEALGRLLGAPGAAAREKSPAATQALVLDPLIIEDPDETPEPDEGPQADEDEVEFGPDAEIGRLARLMLADLRLYNPDRFLRALRDGKLMETFRDELSKGREIVDQRFPEVNTRHEILAAALRDGIRLEGLEAKTG